MKEVRNLIFWPFVRKMNKLLETNDINIVRIENDVPNQAKCQKKEKRVAALWDQISGPNPSMTPQQFSSWISNLKASKHVIQSGDES